ncbi:UdgX family uracil-DNA binding protein [Roseomonas terrae]|uniref:Type-4 uracil-DNA glycosylase n=1 Tax=Neoroseomonas terrae TaxID=424799 RepID=A0ABS5EDI9_9PROT|nr:UdgX family uracil-DNA binding protein [Neoroseomonas terrae]MBR0649082.1 UdgX family uracil-DNA binding protein [Neoroseomonas terrae]
MQTVMLHGAGDVAEWRNVARSLALAGTRPEEIDWREGEEASLFAAQPLPSPSAEVASLRVPRAFLDLAEAVICHADAGRFALLYRILLRLQDDAALLSVAADADIAAAHRMEKSVRRDCHKMTAFVRFREVPGDEGSVRRRFVAWFEPDHHIVRRMAPFFVRRFADMDWMILTPKGSAAFQAGDLTVSDAPAVKPDLADPTDALWLTYYASIFNPARLKVKAMQSEMPKKYWKNLPEAALIPTLIEQVPSRLAAMAYQAAQAPPVFHARIQARRQDVDAEPPAPSGTLAALRDAARTCTRCPLHCQATQTVFGEGPDTAELMIVGEQPGDHEDLAGRPFVGPAGRLFDRTLGEAGIDRAATYVTNAVKHFKHEPRGKRRLHRTPNAGEIDHCRWWLRHEITLVKPKLIVATGATAMFALTGEKGRLADHRGSVQPFDDGSALLVTVHPAYLLRLPDPRAAEDETRRFRADLVAARDWLATTPARPSTSNTRNAAPLPETRADGWHAPPSPPR